jgi:hypothetical protein
MECLITTELDTQSSQSHSNIKINVCHRSCHLTNGDNYSYHQLVWFSLKLIFVLKLSSKNWNVTDLSSSDLFQKSSRTHALGVALTLWFLCVINKSYHCKGNPNYCHYFKKKTNLNTIAKFLRNYPSTTSNKILSVTKHSWCCRFKYMMLKSARGVFRTGQMEDWGMGEINLRRVFMKKVLRIEGGCNGFWYEQLLPCKFHPEF